MYGESVNRHCQVFGMDFSKLLAPGIVFEERLVHVIRHLLRPGSVDLVDFFRVRVVSIKPSELALGVTE